MKRNDRLIAIMMALQQRPETAQALASKLEVSKRTILRDMQALAEMGMPLYALSGPAGGFRLMDGYKLPPLHFDSQEALAVLFSLNAMTKMADTPFNQARFTAIDKIRATMPEHILQHIEPILDRLEISIPDRSYKTPLLEKLLQYAGTSIWIRAFYRSEQHQRSLELLPLRLYTAHGFWYCEAYSVLHEEQRTFRVDRFVELEPIDPPPAASAYLDKAISAEPGAMELVHIAAQLTYRGALLAEQDPHFGQLVKQVDSQLWLLEMDLPMSEWDWAVQFFTHIGMDAEVTQPPALRKAIYQRVCQLAARYEQHE
ncbi:YafY family protein [Paenibacillus sp. KS-LC4]|uniref:helix-turn-helix transcriptional regulator n=1 Tax=Paenibacillus sp. KS-LC4 TaxID=2979727 RepID=UPI0030D1B6AB